MGVGGLSNKILRRWIEKYSSTSDVIAVFGGVGEAALLVSDGADVRVEPSNVKEAAVLRVEGSTSLREDVVMPTSVGVMLPADEVGGDSELEESFDEVLPREEVGLGVGKENALGAESETLLFFLGLGEPGEVVEVAGAPAGRPDGGTIGAN